MGLNLVTRFPPCITNVSWKAHWCDDYCVETAVEPSEPGMTLQKECRRALDTLLLPGRDRRPCKIEAAPRLDLDKHHQLAASCDEIDLSG